MRKLYKNKNSLASSNNRYGVYFVYVTFPSYSISCIAPIEISKINKEYLSWIKKETKQ